MRLDLRLSCREVSERMALPNALSRSMSPLSFMLILSGCCIEPLKNYMLWIINGLQLILLLMTHMVLIGFIMIGYSDEKLQMVFSLRRCMYHVMCIVFLVFMRYNMRSMQRIYRIMRYVKPCNLKPLFWFNVVIIVTKLVTAIFVGLAGLTIQVQKNFEQTWIAVVRTFLSFFSELNACGVGGFGVFMFFLKVIHYHEHDVMEDLLSRIESKMVQPFEVYLKIQRFLDIKECFCQSMSFIPFLMFGFAFVRASIDIFKLQVADNLLGNTYSMLFLMLFAIEMVILALSTSSACNSIRKLLTALEKKIVTSTSDLIPWTPTLNKISEAKRYEFRVWDLFSINNKVLLTLVSSLVTFTVLFIQIIGRFVDKPTL